MLFYALSTITKVGQIAVNVYTERRVDGFWVVLSVVGISAVNGGGAEDYVGMFASGVRSKQLDVQLYLTNQIALAHHGTFSIDATSAQGCKLTLAFPVEEEELSVQG